MIDPLPSDDDPRAGLAEQDPRPVVALARRGVPGAALAAMAIALAVILLVIVDAQRRRAGPAEGPGSSVAAITAPPALAIPPEPPRAAPTPTVVIEVEQAPPPQPPPPRAAPPPLPLPTVIVPVAPVSRDDRPPAPQARLSEPALIIDGGAEVSAAGPPPSAAPQVPGGFGRSPVAAADDTPARATVIRSRTDVMPIGTLIPAVLETPIDTARPGLVRALVSRDTPGFDGRRILVPRGSRLIGEYQSDVRGGQDRVLVTWNRLIRPDGVSIRLGSPAADRMGGAGVRGQVQSFFLQRFAGAVLQSALTVGVNIASRPGNGSVIVGVPSGPVTTIGQQLQAANDYRPKIMVKQGAALNVFVARDLDFSGVGAAR